MCMKCDKAQDLTTSTRAVCNSLIYQYILVLYVCQYIKLLIKYYPRGTTVIGASCYCTLSDLYFSL